MQQVQPALKVRGLKTQFRSYDAMAKAVDDVSLDLYQGQTLGLVGESGCGKSVTALSIMRLIKVPPGRISAEQIRLRDLDLLELSPKEMRAVRGDRISMIFQEPMTSLNPVYTVGSQIAEMFRVHRGLGRRQSWERSVEMLAKVRIPAPEKRAREYPHQLSGGMRQRAMIAMALACNPEILIADEPTTALDVTIQAQILDLMVALKKEFGASILIISHDLGVIARMAQRIMVMYAGKIVEEGPASVFFESPAHPYTRGLLRSVPRLGERSRFGRTRLHEIRGVVPDIFELPPGCSFNPRCSQAMEICLNQSPPLFDRGEGHRVRCWLFAHQEGDV
jgi:peptide/nickel transport system ATP-binding protein/oligopeptide transport system ATP-binding protein